MPSAALRRLYELHEVDQGILEIRKRAAALNVGADLQKKILFLEGNLVTGEGGEAKKLLTEMKDLELSIASHRDKAAKIETELYSGKIVNVREVEAYRADLKAHQDAVSTGEDKLLGMMERADEAQKLVQRIEAKIADLKRQLDERKKSAKIEQARLTAEFERLNKLRPEKTADLDASLLARYDGIRKNYETGMAKVKDATCSGCGNILPERIMTLLKDDKVVTCEQCHRILYYTEGVL